MILASTGNLDTILALVPVGQEAVWQVTLSGPHFLFVNGW